MSHLKDGNGEVKDKKEFQNMFASKFAVMSRVSKAKGTR